MQNIKFCFFANVLMSSRVAAAAVIKMSQSVNLFPQRGEEIGPSSSLG